MLRALRQRGLAVAEHGAVRRTLLPFLRRARDRETLYRQLHSYAFRLFLRDLLAFRDRCLPERLGPFFTPESVEEMTALCERIGLVARGPGPSIRFLADPVTDFGDTFEWFLSEILRREFSADTLWGVKLSGLPCGGDFDIVAQVSGRLLYVEAKTSPPKHIEQREIDAYLERVRILSPDLSILVVDTHLRMKDKLVPLLTEGLRAAKRADCGMVRVEKEIFSWDRRLFLANSRRDIVPNLSVCLRAYFQDRFFD
ncbi:MAG: hypothetical protein Kow00128_04660 [Deltaproteobacteria bacterium]